MSHSRTVRSHEALARMDWTGLKHRQLTGPSWPPRTWWITGRRTFLSYFTGAIRIFLLLINVVLILPPAVGPSAWTTGRSQRSPELRRSPALRWHLLPGRRTAPAGVRWTSWSFCTCNQQKDTHTVHAHAHWYSPWLLSLHLFSINHLCRSNALTVPSSEALTMTKPLEVKVTLLTLLVCSVKVTKQRPLLVFHTLTCGGKTQYDLWHRYFQATATNLHWSPFTVFEGFEKLVWCQ